MHTTDRNPRNPLAGRLARVRAGRHGGQVSGLGDLFHAAEPEHWRQAQHTGTYARSTLGHSLADVGFIHCSFKGQVQGVLDAHFDEAPAVVLLRIDPARLDVPVKVEDLDGGGEAYPHVYGPIPIDAVVDARVLDRKAGRWRAHPDAESVR